LQVRNLGWAEIDKLVDGLAARLPAESCCWGVPRGGSVVAALLRTKHGIAITADYAQATIAVDDLIDSGRTARMVREKYDLGLEPLLVKDNSDWIVFPWEGTELAEDAENTVTRMLQQIGEDPTRPELEHTPRQVVECWDNLFAGYRLVNGEHGEVHRDTPGFAAPSPASELDGMIVVRDIPFISTCENHLIPFFGVADVGWLPAAEAKEFADVPSMVDGLARRLQTQQRLTEQICHAVSEETDGVAVSLKGTYLCRMALGLEARQESFEATAFSGRFRPDPELQRTFLRSSEGSSSSVA
jgi:GTP cyclohydrolase I